MNREKLSTLLEVGSAGAISVGAFLLAVPVGLVVAGGFGLLFARSVAR